jgi:CHAT domain-containing protein
VQLAFTTLLRRKGRALDAMSDNVSALRGRSNPEDQAVFRQLSDERSQLALLTLKGPDKANADRYPALVKQRQDEVDRLEADVSRRSLEFRAQSTPVTLAAVQAVIPAGTALIEFALYRPVDVNGASRLAPRYAAYVLASDGEPQWADLGEAATVDRALEMWRMALRDPERTDVRRLARTVDVKLMQPVRTLLGTSRHLLISPDGPLNLVPFAALVDESGRFLVERFTISYLTSGRDLLRLQAPRASRGGPVIVADPAFGEPAVNATTGTVDFSQVFFGPLPGVSAEVRALKGLLPGAAFFEKEQATEAVLKGVSGPSILHIATHGFFLNDRQRANDASPSSGSSPSTSTDGSTRPPPLRTGATRLGRFAANTDNPLLRSGLALAGANRGASGTDDGLLTALEAAGLDLGGTKLVVLSGCDTGVGEVRTGDGVYGLRRALVLAGAESQVMSLWPVPDRSTSDLMVGYYKRLLNAEGRSDALRQVQLQMLARQPRAHPYYWAGFILSGQWATLDDKP